MQQSQAILCQTIFNAGLFQSANNLKIKTYTLFFWKFSNGQAMSCTSMEIFSVIQVMVVSKVLLQKATGLIMFSLKKMFCFSSKNLPQFNELYPKMLLARAFALLRYY
uniref:Uncharacterized protein n=1 Tax=Micrurus paraensis TaxID=1970185 RepID=A0A2D4KGG4_9SAUR